jgi:general secretion pathway protein G
MRKILRVIIPGTVAVGLGFLALNGCNRPGAGTIKSAEPTSFNEVTSHLDPGGNLYVYLGTEQWLDGISGKISGWRQFVVSMPQLGPAEREKAGKVFDVVTNLIKDSGLEDVSGFGMSGIASEKGFYHSKAFVHHYPNRGTGFLWKMFGSQPHALTGLDMLPTNTALATFSDVDIPLVWSVLQKEVSQSGLPEAAKFLDNLPAQFERAAGLKWDQVLGSLGGEFGLVVTLDESKMIPIPLPTQQGLQIPEPGILIVAKVKDDTIFNRLDQLLQQKAQQQLESVNEAGLKMRTVAVPLPLPIQLRPTIATSDGYLFIATSDAMVRQVIAVKAGRQPGLKSTDQFKHLAKDIPEQGNEFAFVSQRLGQTLMEIQQQAMQMSGKLPPAQQQWLQSMMSPEKAAYSYSVSANLADGWLTVGNGNQQPAKMLVASAVMVPVGIMGMMAAIAIPNFVKARQVSQENACINNLRQIDGAKQQWALEHNKTAKDVPTKSDLLPYLRRWPACPAGGEYTIGAVGEKPTCSIPGHGLPN